MKRAASFTLVLCFVLCRPVSAEPPFKPFITGLKNPESVTVSSDGRVFISTIGEFGKDGDGAIMVLDKGKAVPFATGLDDPKGIAFYQKWIFVADNKRVLKIDMAGKVQVFAAAKDFPKEPLFLNDIAVDPETGTVFVSDSGDLKGKDGAVFRITPKGKVDLLVDVNNLPQIQTPNGLAMDGKSFLLMVDFGFGQALSHQPGRQKERSHRRGL